MVVECHRHIFVTKFLERSPSQFYAQLKKKLVKLQKFSTLVDALQSRISALNYF